MSRLCIQVGSTAFVGLLEGTGGVSWSVMGKTAFGWVFTLVIVGFLSALLMVLGIRTPNLRNGKSINLMEQSIVSGGAAATEGLVEAGCPGSPALEVLYHLALHASVDIHSLIPGVGIYRRGRCMMCFSRVINDSVAGVGLASRKGS